MPTGEKPPKSLFQFGKFNLHPYLQNSGVTFFVTQNTSEPGLAMS
jgi:hypothetical protein